jgi:hypothetical protein
MSTPQPKLRISRVVTANQVRESAAKHAELEATTAKQKKRRKLNRKNGGLHAIDRTAHVSSTREARSSKVVSKPLEKQWRRGSELPALQNPPGCRLKWVRCDTRKDGDGRGVARHRLEGWEFARPDDFPGIELPTHDLPRFGTVIGNGDNVLMKNDERVVAQRNAYYKQKRMLQMQGVKQELKESITDRRMPLVEGTFKSATDLKRFRRPRDAGKRVVAVADDTD